MVTAIARWTPATEPDFASLLAMGEALVSTGMLPERIKTGAQAAAIILAGRELGMPPMRALRSLYLQRGKIEEDAASQLARFKFAGGKATFEALTPERAELRLTHPNGDEHTEIYTMEDARRAGLTGDTWRKHPRAMLRSRAITAGHKSIGWEGAVGAYDPDEVREFLPAPAPAARAFVPSFRVLGPPQAQTETVTHSAVAESQLEDPIVPFTTIRFRSLKGEELKNRLLSSLSCGELKALHGFVNGACIRHAQSGDEARLAHDTHLCAVLAQWISRRTAEERAS